MLIAAFIFVMSMAAVIQFAALSWRAGLLRVASEPLAEEWEAIAASSSKSLISQGFTRLAAYNKLCPDVATGSAPKLVAVRLYHQLLRAAQACCEATAPSMNLDWTSREMALCTRYAAVTLSHRLERNQALLASVRAF
ncbi:MAG TPA: hypothetical protein VLY23_07050 [Candidatus Acidoferrum sp.]|nr:hypothetical protein [Candidatus Acidoferrum sp.]